MSISVTIVTKNRAKHLDFGLQSLAAQTFPQKDFEVIVADNGSIDHTKEVVQSFSSRIENLRYIFDSRPGQLVGWHRALSAANGDVTCFIDDDIRPCPDWLASLEEIYHEKSIGMVTGPIELSFEMETPSWLNHMILGARGGKTLPFLGLLDCGEKIREIPSNFVWGSNFSVRKSLLESAGGFHPCAMPRDLLHFYGDGEIHVGRYISEQGYKVYYHPNARVVHDIPNERLTLEAVELKFETSAYARSFQTLRERGNPYSMPTNVEIRLIADNYFRRPSLVPLSLRTAVIDGLTRGFKKHLDYFKSDLDFRIWVLKENYLDLDDCYKNPSLAAYRISDQDKSDWRQGNKGK